MIIYIYGCIASGVANIDCKNPDNQIKLLKDHKRTTTDAGIPVSSDEHSLTIGPDGPILLHDHYLIEQMAQFNRERIPERQPHAKGSGAFGLHPAKGRR